MAEKEGEEGEAERDLGNRSRTDAETTVEARMDPRRMQECCSWPQRGPNLVRLERLLLVVLL